LKIEIKSRWDSSKIILCGEYEGIRDCLEKNKGANLSGADLSGANLSRATLYGADLSGANLSGADLSGANLYGANLSRADLSGANLSGANLSGANLSGANLSRANLSGADLYGADLSRATLYGADLYGADLKNYSESHDIFMQLIKEKIIKFTKQEQEIASRVFVLRLCWGSIKKEYGKKMDSIFKKLDKLGCGEYLTKWNAVKGDKII
jgi:hypothetical protein